MKTIPESNFKFLRQLGKNNDREWFMKNKHIYQHEHENIVSFADALIAELNKHDVIETASGKKSVFRIYRDVRFSKNKTPYRTHFAGIFSRATAAKTGHLLFSSRTRQFLCGWRILGARSAGHETYPRRIRL